MSKETEIDQETEPQETKKSEKPRRKKEEKAFRYYKIDGKVLERLRPFCERCGPGYFMADHGNRYTCGNCGFTRYKQNQ